MRRHTSSSKRAEKAKQCWGASLTKVDDVAKVFVKYAKGERPAYMHEHLTHRSPQSELDCRLRTWPACTIARALITSVLILLPQAVHISTMLQGVVHLTVCKVPAHGSVVCHHWVTKETLAFEITQLACTLSFCISYTLTKSTTRAIMSIVLPAPPRPQAPSCQLLGHCAAE